MLLHATNHRSDHQHHRRHQQHRLHHHRSCHAVPNASAPTLSCTSLRSRKPSSPLLPHLLANAPKSCTTSHTVQSATDVMQRSTFRQLSLPHRLVTQQYQRQANLVRAASEVDTEGKDACDDKNYAHHLSNRRHRFTTSTALCFTIPRERTRR